MIVATHGEFSKGLLNTLSMIVGEEIAEKIDTFSLLPGKDARDYVTSFAEEMDSDTDYVILTDLIGGSVDNAFTSLLSHPNIWIISGVNLPLLLDITLDQNSNTEYVCLRAVENAKSGIFLRKEIELIEEDDDF